METEYLNSKKIKKEKNLKDIVKLISFLMLFICYKIKPASTFLPNTVKKYIPESMIRYNDIEGIRKAIALGANVNAFYDDRHNALLLVAEKSFEANPEVISILLGSGADFRIKNKAGKSFLDILEQVRGFFKRFPTKEGFICNDGELWNISIIKSKYEKLVEEQLCFLPKLMEAIEKDQKKTIIDILQKYPSLINLKNDLDETPLINAILFRRYEIIKDFFENPLIKIKPKFEYDLFEYIFSLEKQVNQNTKEEYREIAKLLRSYRNVCDE